MGNKYTLLFLLCCLVFLLIPYDKPIGIYYYFIMILFSSGITVKAWLTFK